MSAVAEALASAQPHRSLPAGWARVRLGDICDAINGRAFKSSEWRESGLPIVRIQNLKDPEAEFNYFSGELNERHRVRQGDLLFAWSGTPGTSFGAHIWQGSDAALNQHIFKIMFDPDVLDPRYFCLALNQNVSRYVAQAQGGVGLAHITKSKFLNSFIPLAPKAKQLELLAEIEKQFSRLDEAVANLKRVKANLKRYKAAVLTAAAEGRLVPTEADLARHEGRAFESGDQLLLRVLERRRSLWKGKGRYADPCSPDTKDLPPLPDGWAYATAEQLTDSNRTITYGVIKLGASVDGGVPVLRSSDVRSLRINMERVKTIAPSIAAEYRRTFLEGGEVVVTVRGTLGGVAVAPTTCRGFNVSREVAMLAMVEPEVAYAIAQFIAATAIQKWLMARTKGIAYTGINIETLRALPIPVPPLQEQRRIRTETERLLSLVSELTNEVDSSLLRAQGMRRATLQRALEEGV